MSENKPKISIIIPAYNAEITIRKCIESVLNQTYQDFELIIINDGSEDSTGSICDEYNSKDNRIRVIHQKNQGVSSARNIGINRANGEYTAFVDSDDWIETDYIENLLSASSNYDFVFTNMISREGGHVINENKNVIIINDTLKTLIRDFNILTTTGPCCKLFKTNILIENNIYFPADISFGEDAIFFLKYIRFIHSAYFVADSGYHYCYTENSLSNRILDQEKLLISSAIYHNLCKSLCRETNCKETNHEIEISSIKLIIKNSLSVNFSNNKQLWHKTIKTIYIYDSLTLLDNVFWLRAFLKYTPGTFGLTILKKIL